MAWKPQTQWWCTCGHCVEDHGEDPDWPCLACSTCEAFQENLTQPLFDIGGS